MSTSSAAKCVSPKFAGECLQKRQITVEKLSVINANDSIVVEIEVFCGYKCTDKGNADRMVALYGNDIRHCRGLKTWLLWDRVRWVPDKVDRILEIAKNTAVLIDAEVSFEQDIERKTELRKWAKESESERRLKAMIELAKSDPRIELHRKNLMQTAGWSRASVERWI